MLTNLKPILAGARADHYCVPAFDCVEDVMVRALLDTAEARRSPIILSVLEPDLAGRGINFVPGLIRAVADTYSIPVALHYDHAATLDEIRRGIDAGFTSVMIDGSKLSFAENVKLTRQTVELAKPHGITVEAELGHVGGMDLAASACGESVLTEAGEVAQFVAETGVDALAVSIGTAHGVYRSLPTLNIPRLKELHAASSVPLVLHGGSGTPDDQIRNAVRTGICKLNIYADLRIAMGKGLKAAHAAITRPDPLPQEIFGPIAKALAGVVNEKIDLLGSANRV
jgi:fructose-bisphosphate aldolase class II